MISQPDMRKVSLIDSIPHTKPVNLATLFECLESGKWKCDDLADDRKEGIEVRQPLAVGIVDSAPERKIVLSPNQSFWWKLFVKLDVRRKVWYRRGNHRLRVNKLPSRLAESVTNLCG